MPHNRARQAIVAQAVQARHPARTGGTQAPRAAGPRMGIGQGRPTRPQLRAGLGAASPAGGARGPGGSAGAQAQGSAPVAAPTPWNSKAEQIVAGARRSYLDASNNFDLSEQQAKGDFGLDPGFNDYKSNPYSRAALLEQSYQNANRGTINSAGLQLYSGSTSNALDANRGAYGRSRDELAKTYRDALGEISAGRAKAAQERAEAEREAEWDRIAAAESAEPEPEAAPSSSASGQPKRKQKPKGGGKGGGGAGPGIAPARPAGKSKGKGR